MSHDLRAIRSVIEEPPDSEVGMSRLRRAKAQLGRLHRSLEARKDPRSARVLLALDPVLAMAAPFERYAELLETAAVRARELDPTLHAAVLRAVGRFWSARGAQRVAIGAVTAARDVIAHAGGETPLHAGLRLFVTAHAGSSWGSLHDPERATIELERLAASAERNQARLRALAGNARGMIELARHRPRASIEAFTGAVDAARSACADRTLAISLANRGEAFLAMNELQEATTCFGKSLGMFVTLGDPVHATMVRSHLLLVAAARNRPPSTASVLAAVTAHERLGDHKSAARMLIFLAARARATESRRAAAWLSRAWASLAKVDDCELEARARELTERLEPQAGGSAPTLEVDERCTTARFGTCEIDLRARRALPHVLAALVSARLEHPGARLDVPAVFVAGWPGEKAAVHAAAARVYMAIRALRAAGLGPAITTTAAGYRIEPEVRVQVRAGGFRRI